VNLLRRIAAFFDTRPTYEQIHEAVRLPACQPPKEEKYEMVETTDYCWHVSTMIHSVFSDTPWPEFRVIESKEFDFDPVSFDAVKKPSRMAYYIWRRKA